MSARHRFRGAARSENRRTGFTLVELLVVISIVALLIALLLPALGSAKESGRTVKCLSNERQMAIAIAVYVNESLEWWPISSYAFCGHTYHDSPLWTGVVAHYSPNRYNTEFVTNWVKYPNEVVFTSYTETNKPKQGILKCPSDVSINAWGGTTSVPYAYNGTFGGLGVNDYFTQPDASIFYGVNGPIYADGFGRIRSPSIRKPSLTVLLADINASGGYEYSGYRLSGWNGPPTAYDSLATYHTGGTTNVLWTDGHANTRKPATMTAADFDRRD